MLHPWVCGGAGRAGVDGAAGGCAPGAGAAGGCTAGNVGAPGSCGGAKVLWN